MVRSQPRLNARQSLAALRVDHDEKQKRHVSAESALVKSTVTASAHIRSLLERDGAICAAPFQGMRGIGACVDCQTHFSSDSTSFRNVGASRVSQRWRND